MLAYLNPAELNTRLVVQGADSSSQTYLLMVFMMWRKEGKRQQLKDNSETRSE